MLLAEEGQLCVQVKKVRTVEDHPAALHMQQALMTQVALAAETKALAESAFRSFVRSYAAHPQSVRDVFHVRRLHLGHVAPSFALR